MSSVDLVDSMGGDRSVVRAARVSRGDDADHRDRISSDDERLIRYMIRHRHTSPFEHVTLTFRVTCPVYVARQWMRHRTWSYNEISRRYTSDDVDVERVPQWRKQAATNKQSSAGVVYDQAEAAHVYDAAMSVALDAYRRLLALGVGREQARAVLPMSLMTSFYGTVNLHNLFHFVALRTHADAQREIQALAAQCLAHARAVAPFSVAAWEDTRAGAA